MFDLSGKRIVVTGAGSGLGLEFSRGFAASGAEVICPIEIAPVRNRPRQRFRRQAVSQQLFRWTVNNAGISSRQSGAE